MNRGKEIFRNSVFKKQRNLSLAAMVCFAGLSNAQTYYEPVILTGFNADVIANGTGPASGSTSNDVDGVNYAFVAEDFKANSNSNSPLKYLPNGGLITSGLKTFQLENYSSNNSLRLSTGSATGTLYFSTASAASKVHVLGVSGSGYSDVQAVVWFSDNTSETFNSFFPDWFNSSGNIVFWEAGRINRTNNTLEAYGGPQLFEVELNISLANQTKQIEKITFSKTNTGTSVMNILSVSTSIILPCVGAPDAGSISGVSSICPDNPFTLNGAEILLYSGIDYQWQQSVTGSNLWTNIAGETSSVYDNNSGITEAIDYRLVVTCANGNGSDTTDVATVNLELLINCYCQPPQTMCNDFNIKDVIVAGESQGINNLNTSCDMEGYTDFTHLSANLIPGNTYSGNVTTGLQWPEANIRIWIDYNKNGIFEESETIAKLANLDVNSSGDFSFTVPLLTTYGATTMRVKIVAWENPDFIEPCFSMSFEGETQDYTIVFSADPLAITLGNIQVQNKGKENIVEWQTLKEEIGDRFIIERSPDGQTFKEVGFQNGKGTPATYQFTDSEPISGINFYRLVLLNSDGSRKYSKIVHATVKGNNFSIEVHPNPASDVVTIKFHGKSDPNGVIIIADLSGRIIKTFKVTGSELSISLANLSSAIYSIKYIDETENAIIKLIKK